MTERQKTVFFIDRCLGSVRLATAERLAVASANLRMFVLVAQNLPGEDMIIVFHKAFSAMREFARKNPAPFIAKVYESGEVSEWKKHEELLTELQKTVQR
ncbi:MAG: hypothetical protein AAGF01_17290 [Cyanobacteria bacterium P01_G01_bin.38]